MAEIERQRHGAIQDTGNPVLDSTINLLMNWPCNNNFQLEQIAQVHEKIAELYEREPKQADPTKRKTLREMERDAKEVGAR
jgi:hypothetical protein